MDYIEQAGIRIAKPLYDFVNGEALPGTSIGRDAFWNGFAAILADLGMSSFALNDPSRGFSFRGDGPLDMRMDPELPVSAYDIVNREEEVELARIIFTYGEERHSRRIARRMPSPNGRRTRRRTA